MSTLENAKDLGAGVYTQAEVNAQVSQGKNSAKSTVLKGDFTLSNTVLQAGFAAKLYVGNGGTQSIVNNINLKDNWVDYSGLSQWTAGTYNIGQEFFILDSSLRKLRVVCLQDGVTSDPNTLLDFTDATFSDWKIESSTYGGMVWLKNRDGATAYDNKITDTLRGATKEIVSNSTAAEGTSVNGVTGFNIDGFSIGSGASYNNSTINYVSWAHQTTNVVSGLTNHNKPYIKEYNPASGFTQVKYKGSGLVGHIYDMEADFVVIKRLTTDLADWVVRFRGQKDGETLTLNQDYASSSFSVIVELLDKQISLLSTSSIANTNNNGETYISYGWKNSYFDDEGTLQGNYEIGVYGGTGATGNKIKTKGKPAYLMQKRIDIAENWRVFDNQRNAANNELYPNLSNSEPVVNSIDFEEDGFVLTTTASGYNALNGQYLYFVIYDNDSGSGASKYPKASETSEITVTNGLLAYSNGADANGVKSSIENVGSVTFTGINWDI